jgi:hypothetical protein
MSSLMSALCHLLLVAQLHLNLIWMLWQDMAGVVECDAYLPLWELLRTMFLRSSYPFLCLSTLPPLYGMSLGTLLLLSGEKSTPGTQVGTSPNALTPPFAGGMKLRDLGGA